MLDDMCTYVYIIILCFQKTALSLPRNAVTIVQRNATVFQFGRRALFFCFFPKSVIFPSSVLKNEATFLQNGASIPDYMVVHNHNGVRSDAVTAVKIHNLCHMTLLNGKQLPRKSFLPTSSGSVESMMEALKSFRNVHNCPSMQFPIPEGETLKNTARFHSVVLNVAGINVTV
jgi:hypothetical protein